MLARKDYELKTLLPSLDTSPSDLPLLSLVYKRGQYWVFHGRSLADPSLKNHAERVWRVVKYEVYRGDKVNKLRVCEGDLIKFGRVRFRVKRIVVGEEAGEKRDNNQDGDEST